MSVCNLPEPQNARRGEAITADVMKKIQWLQPTLVAQIEFTEWTKGHHLRHSRFVALREDKKSHGGDKRNRLKRSVFSDEAERSIRDVGLSL